MSSPKITDQRESSNSLVEYLKFRFPEHTDDMQHHILNLSIHQGLVMETFGDITASCTREGTEFDLTADISAQAQMLDGTNACVFNSLVMADWFRINKMTKGPLSQVHCQRRIANFIL